MWSEFVYVYLFFFFFFSSRRRHTRCSRDWSSDVCSSDLRDTAGGPPPRLRPPRHRAEPTRRDIGRPQLGTTSPLDRKSTRLNSSHGYISYAVFCLKKKNIEYRDKLPHRLRHPRSHH